MPMCTTVWMASAIASRTLRSESPGRSSTAMCERAVSAVVAEFGPNAQVQRERANDENGSSEV
jgi:hypothetical protein